jgi:3-deoxy-D-manno-octulosonic-acid transferase/heptosyltransferase-1
MIFDFQAALKGAMLIALARGKRKIGFGPGMQHQEHSYLVLNQRVPMISMEVHALERGLALLKAVDIPTGAIEYRLPISTAARDKVAGLIGPEASLPGDVPIAINPMAKWESKLWLPDRFAQLADRLIDRFRATIYFTGGPQDREAIDTIQHGMRHKSINLAGHTSLIELAALYEQMACVISTDTGPMHIAAAVERPVVALFGPTAEWRTGPFGDRHRVVTASERCRPCFKRKCPELRCMEKIPVEQVLQQVEGILA